jgi:hypothetical protein
MTLQLLRRQGLRLAALVALAACPDPVDSDRAVIDAWLGCIECSDGELQAVLDLAAVRPQATSDTLGAALLRGPTPQERSNLQRQFETVYHRLATRLGSGNLQVTLAEYVRHYSDNVTAIYRIRAAQALARIPGPAAKQYLDFVQADSLSTPGDTLRPDVRRAIFLADSAFNP